VGWTVGVTNETVDAAAGGGVTTDGMRDGAVARWAAENPRSAALSARARHLFPGGVTHDVRLAYPFPLAVARAEGARKWDLDGHELVCYVMGHGALLLGTAIPRWCPRSGPRRACSSIRARTMSWSATGPSW